MGQILIRAALPALCLLAVAVRPAPAGVAVETNDLLTMEYQQTGANEEEAVRLACIRGVKATVGRLLFSDYKLQAADLLEPYIQKNYQKFVASYYVLERRTDRNGFGVRIRVQTFPEVMARDLREKRFLVVAQASPYHYVFLKESVDGGAPQVPTGRRAAIDAILKQGGKVYESGVESPRNDVNAMVSPEVFTAAREAATRIGADIVVTGEVACSKVGSKEILYDNLTTYETVATIEFIHSSDGERMGSERVVQRASDKDAASARDQSIVAAVEAAVAKAYEDTRAEWRRHQQAGNQFELMLSNVLPTELHNVSRHLEQHLGHGSKVTMRTYYGNVATVGVRTPRQYAALQRALQDFSELDLRVTDRRGKRITVEVRP